MSLGQAKKFSGSIVAMVTPFLNGKVDYETLSKLVEWQVSQGSDGVVACGSTGELATLSLEEQLEVIKVCKQTIKGRVPLIVGAGLNGTQKTIELIKEIEPLGVDGLLVVTPYYNKPGPEGIYQHFKAVHDATDLPLILYNVPSRCMVEISVETIVRLAKLERVVALKDATPDLARPLQIRARMGDKLTLLSGEDSTLAAFLAQGGDGVISVMANVLPKESAELCRLWNERKLDEFHALNCRLQALRDILFIESNPIPVKAALSLMGKCSNEVRLPLLSASEESISRIKKALTSVGL